MVETRKAWKPKQVRNRNSRAVARAFKSNLGALRARVSKSGEGSRSTGSSRGLGVSRQEIRNGKRKVPPSFSNSESSNSGSYGGNGPSSPPQRRSSPKTLNLDCLDEKIQIKALQKELSARKSELDILELQELRIRRDYEKCQLALKNARLDLEIVKKKKRERKTLGGGAPDCSQYTTKIASLTSQIATLQLRIVKVSSEIERYKILGFRCHDELARIMVEITMLSSATPGPRSAS